MRSWCLVGLLFSMWSAQLARAQEAVEDAAEDAGEGRVIGRVADGARLPDVVRLHDGSFVRGTIVERIEGERVVIASASGELRTFAMSDIAFAGPETREITVRADGEGPARVRHPVTLRSEPAGLRLYVERSEALSFSSSRFEVGVLNSYELVCTAPCSGEILEGEHAVAIGVAGGRPLGAGTLSVGSALALSLRFEDRSVARGIGAAMMIFGGVPGLAMFAIAIGTAVGGTVDPGFLAVGIVGTAIALGGIPLLAWGDTREVRVLGAE